MPELPELEHARWCLENALVGLQIDQVEADPKGAALILRDQIGGGLAACTGARVSDVLRRGKFLILELVGAPCWLVINPKLAGRLQLCDRETPPLVANWFTFHFRESTRQLRYADDKRMGQLYLTNHLQDVPTYDAMGPSALEVDRPAFHARLRKYRGEIKGILSRESFLAGIGNAYADEILWQAGLHPYRKRPTLSVEEVDQLYEAIRITLLEACHLVRQASGDDIHLKPRFFFRVHLRGGEPCPRCGTTVSEIRARQQLTNFCRTCQPGGLFQGMG
jgi:formamidopyrimidine-DNA glycosylase